MFCLCNVFLYAEKSLMQAPLLYYFQFAREQGFRLKSEGEYLQCG